MSSRVKDDKTVYITFCIDTEGPLYESLQAKFERLEHLFSLKNLKVSRENLELLKDGKIDLGGKEEDVQRVLNGHLANYNETWDQVEEMLNRFTSPDFRNKTLDSYGQGFIYNWFLLDHVGFTVNPRRRDLGFHNIFDFYRDYISLNLSCHKDGFQWHFHPVSTYNEAHRCATSYFRTPEIFEILSRKIIERNWFPSAFRAGFQAERPDCNFFLEQWIPFDISNMAMEDNTELEKSTDFRKGRSGNWRKAPADWSVYHPSHDDYQIEGNCRRWIGRALNVLNRIGSVDQNEVDKAFARAEDKGATLLGVAVHDFRDLCTDADHLLSLVKNSAKKYPNVKFKFSEVVEAFRSVTGQFPSEEDNLKLSIKYNPESSDDVANIDIACESGNVFGPQPWLAIETKSKLFIHDNLDFGDQEGLWHYAFHGDTLPIEDVSAIGVGASDKFGNTDVKVLRFKEPKDFQRELIID